MLAPFPDSVSFRNKVISKLLTKTNAKVWKIILEKHFLDKEEIENFLNEIREIGLEEKDIDYCIKKTLN